MANYSDVRFANINYEIYAAGNRFLGNGEVSLPELEFMSVDMSGAGLAGKFSAPIKGFVDSAELEITWHTINDDLNFFTVPSAKDLILYSAMENYDSSSGNLKAEQVKISIRGFNKKTALGSLKPAEQTETKTTLEIIYMNVSVAGKVIVEFDKINYKYIVNGTDYLADVRTALNRG